MASDDAIVDLVSVNRSDDRGFYLGRTATVFEGGPTLRSQRRAVLTQMAAEVREVNISKGWRRADGSNDHTVGDDTALLASEVFEAYEQWREIGFDERTREDGKPDDFGSEMADVLIRLLDTCDRRGVDLTAEYERKLAYNRTRPYLHGGKAI